MCLAKVYLKGNGEKELLLESVAFMEVKNNRLLLSTIFGERKEIEAGIQEVDFQNSNIILAKPDESEGKWAAFRP